MFFVKDLQHAIALHPSYFGPSTQPYLQSKLYQDVEGTCTGRYGYIITACVCPSLSEPRWTVAQMAEFDVQYKAIVFKPFKGEVLEGVVSTVNKMGFFAEVGPLNIFISTHHIPNEMKFDPDSNPPRYAAGERGEEDAIIEKGTRVRVKLLGCRVDATEIFAIGTIKEDYLGPVADY